jgi:hypothetical protein
VEVVVEVVVEQLREVMVVEVVEVVGVVEVHQRLGQFLQPFFPPTTEVAMAVRIEQLEQRLATMASFQHRSHTKGLVLTSYGGDNLFYMASVTQIEVFIAMTRGVTRASKPCGATVELDP